MIQTIQQKDAQHILHIADMVLGKNYLTTQQIDHCVEATSGVLLKVSEKIVGFILWSNEVPDAIESYIKMHNCIYISTVAILPQEQAKGYGMTLFRHLLDRFEPGQKFATLGWTVDGHCNLAPLVEKFGFKKVAVLSNIWKSTCETQMYECPSYEGSCKCSGSLYVR